MEQKKRLSIKRTSLVLSAIFGIIFLPYLVGLLNNIYKLIPVEPEFPIEIWGTGLFLILAGAVFCLIILGIGLISYKLYKYVWV